jgi:heme/copper-type cytochrome/quinol oxidase subunit 3
LVATLILVASSASIVLSTLAARRGQLVRVRVGLLVTIALGVVFLILQRQIIDASLRAFHPGTDAYGSIFYTLLGLHAAHVVLGVLLAAWAVLRTIRFDRSAVVTVRVVSFYVHFVNVVAAVVFLALYVSPRG